MAKKSKNPVGRPKLTLDDLPGDWQEVMTQCYEQGGTDVEVRTLLVTKDNPRGISSETFYRFAEDHEEFLATIKRGKDLSYAWWIGRGRMGVGQGKDFNATAFIFMMKNMFGWGDKTGEESADKVPANIRLQLGDKGDAKTIH